MIDWLCKIVVMGSKADKDALKTIRVKADAIIQSAYKAYERAARLAPKDDEDTNA
jgi:hypothetical protein